MRLAAGIALAVGLTLVLAPAEPTARVWPPAACAAGALAGVILYAGVTRRRPYVPLPLPAAVAAFAVLVVAATGEEVVWRRVVLGELLRAGPLAALAGSTLGFALVHRTRQLLHVGTGAAFGGLYVVTGVLAASIAAHAAYNVLLLSLAERRRRGVP